MTNCATRSDTLYPTTRFVVLQNCWLKRLTGRYGGDGRKRNTSEYSEYDTALINLAPPGNKLRAASGKKQRISRHDKARSTAKMRTQLERLVLRNELLELDAENIDLAGTSSESAFCPQLGMPVDSTRGFVTDDEASYIQVHWDQNGRITGAFVRPRGRYYD